jgi:hypothetical protein
MARWLGVDVGAERKGFDVALVDEHALRELRGGLSVALVVELAVAWSPVLVAVDGPRTCAPIRISVTPSPRRSPRASTDSGSPSPSGRSSSRPRAR